MPWLDLNGGSRLKSNSEDTQPKIEIFLPEPKGCTPTIIIFSYAIYVLHIPNNLFSLTFDIKHKLTLNPFSTKTAFLLLNRDLLSLAERIAVFFAEN